MATIPAGFASVSVQLKHSASIRPCFVTHGVELVSTETPDDLATEILTAFKAAYLGRIDSNATVGPVTIHIGPAENPGTGVSDPTDNALGTNTMEGAPINCALLVRKNTIRGGRRGRGRFFMPFVLNEAVVDEVGLLTTGFLSTMDIQHAAYLTALDAAGAQMVLLHSPGETAELGPNVVTSLVSQSLIGTQRRRLGR